MEYWKTIVLSTLTLLALSACSSGSKEWNDATLSCVVSEIVTTNSSINANVKCSDTDGITEASVNIKNDSSSIQSVLLNDNSKSIDANISFNGLEENTLYTIQATISSLNAQIDEIESRTFEANITTLSIEVANNIVPTVTNSTVVPLVDNEVVSTEKVDSSSSETPPIIGTLTNQTLENEEELNYTLPITQTDGDIATVVVSGLPTGFSYDDATRTITGSSTTAWTTEVTVEATDDDGSVSENFSIVVGEANNAPTLNIEVSTVDWNPVDLLDPYNVDADYTIDSSRDLIIDARTSSDSDGTIENLTITSKVYDANTWNLLS